MTRDTRTVRAENRRLRRLVLALSERCYLMSQHLTLIAERQTYTDRRRRLTTDSLNPQE